MTVIFRCKPKVSAALCCISCLFHRSQHQSADHHFIRHSLNLLKNLLNFLWCDFLTCFLHLNPLMSQKRKKAFHSFRIRIVMRTVNKRIFSWQYSFATVSFAISIKSSMICVATFCSYGFTSIARPAPFRMILLSGKSKSIEPLLCLLLLKVPIILS